MSSHPPRLRLATQGDDLSPTMPPSMSRTHRLVIDDRGVRGTLVTELDPDTDRVAVDLEDEARRVHVDRRRLAPREGGGYCYDGAFPPAEAEAETGSDPEAETVEEHRIPLAREHVRVDRQTRETGRVRIRKRVREHTETIDEPVRQETVSVERVPIDRIVEAPPSTRQEGDVLIIPVVEERLVVTKQLVLKEEIRVTRQQREQRDARPITLRHEEVEVEREEGPADAHGDEDR